MDTATVCRVVRNPTNTILQLINTFSASSISLGVHCDMACGASDVLCTVCTWHGDFCNIKGKDVVLAFGFILSCRTPPRTYLCTYLRLQSHNCPRAISKIMNWVPIVLCSSLCNECVQFLWPKHLLPLGHFGRA